MEVGAVKAHDSEETNHASDYDNRSRYCEVGFQIHGVDAEGKVALRRQLKRRYVLALFAEAAAHT
jgi:hypothetical protein